MDLNIRGLGKRFEGSIALHPTDLKIRQGKFTTLLGPSGCGKTTLLRLIAGLERPDTGSISFGEDILYNGTREVPPHRRGFGMVFQDFALWPHMTVFENVAFGFRATGRKNGIHDKVMEALDKVKLAGMEQRYPHQLSGGQQQRVAFARAVATRPRLVLFDEPLSALDAVLRDEMRLEMMYLVREMGLTALYVTHDQIEAMSMSDEVIVMHSGQVLQKGSPEDIYNHPEHPFVARFIGKSNWLADGQSMFRPEHIRFDQGEQKAESYAAVVTHVSYMGDRYEVKLKTDESPEPWLAYHPERLREGTEVMVYLPQQCIHRLKEN
ncbi:ABC transporter ATP-binding protein [Paenibacillus donghaensis]|uniref:ABC transporter ATP-binding protein n=1 Tax=Paenibacillus donghaensis TaxID=414771 RepID=UPI001884048C|nr:ABC transporter ATP-binding protein [Paenibacillus donghaensis]MBE9915191.1 ABC transporter ATP-binding protein [Paenibacillus donghaensis]